MQSDKLPPNVYRLPQRRFDAIPSSPWTYRVSESMRQLFEDLPLLSSAAVPRQGLTTADNGRFIRYWWEVKSEAIQFNCANRREASQRQGIWYPLVKGGQSKPWFGAEISVGNWENDGKEIKAYIVEQYPYLDGNWEWVAKNPECYFLECAAYSAVTSGLLCFRWIPQGYICEHASNGVYSQTSRWTPRRLVGLFNSALANYVVGLNETINVNIDDLLRMPLCQPDADKLEVDVGHCINLRQHADTVDELYNFFIAPPRWHVGLNDLAAAQVRLSDLEQRLDEEVYRLYGISNEDRAAIEAELAGGRLHHDTLESDEGHDSEQREAGEGEVAPAAAMTRQELAVRWISYAVGVVLGRFRVGGSPPIPPTLGGDTLPPSSGGQAGPHASVPPSIGGQGGQHGSTPPSIGGSGGPLGSAIYRRIDFAVGSLPAPDEAEFDQLVGTPDRFAYVDAEGGRHLFGAQAEAALCELAVPDGITALDEGHPRDLAALVEKALDLMLGDKGKQEVVNEGAQGDLRGFLAGDFFRRWHLKWYRKRPVYWPLQSARRSYGFVVFHEKVERSFLYTLQRDYLDYKRNSVRLAIDDMTKRMAAQTGAQRRSAERQIDDARKTLDELNEFAKTLARIAGQGYEPAMDWIDDGVILRLAPLWELLPLWKTEPKKYWEALQNGDFDWSHIAMRYWPDRVRKKCTTNKSFAIAHGHEEWNEGA